MKYLNLSLPTPQENLALDDLLLQQCEAGFIKSEVLRFWESNVYFVVLGYSQTAEKEAHLPNCRLDNIPVLRRISGGGAVLQGPGCFNYSVIMKIPEGQPRNITGTNRFIMNQIREGLVNQLRIACEIQGDTDLTVNNVKISGNAQKRAKRYLLFHGTFLYRFDFSKVSRYLRYPAKEPGYRMGRDHQEFLQNIGCLPDEIESAMRTKFQTDGVLKEPSRSAVSDIVANRYALDVWNFKR